MAGGRPGPVITLQWSPAEELTASLTPGCMHRGMHILALQHDDAWAILFWFSALNACQDTDTELFSARQAARTGGNS